jgi:thiosulfate/3-mercaptopyruvate sulfurtransferase
MNVPLLVSTAWLADRLTDPGIRIADVRWSLLEKDKGRDAHARAHVPGAAFIDVDTDLASPRGEGPGRHPLPRPERFAASMARIGIGEGTHVVAYDFGDGSTAARLWWLLRYFGHDRVSLLDGGMARWNAEGRPVEAAAPSFPPGAFHPRPRPGMVVDAAAVERLRSDPLALILDARAAERYEGRVEPIDPVAGHIPGAKSHPYSTNVRAPEDPRFIEPRLLREAFERLGADRAGRVVCYCGSGVNACQNMFALQLAGFDPGVLYEGSWSDWCSEPGRAMRTGPAP